MQSKPISQITDTPAGPAPDRLIEDLLDTDGLKRARTYAKLVLGSRTRGDVLLTDAISHCLQHRSVTLMNGSCFLSLLQAMRMLARQPRVAFGPADSAIRNKALLNHFALPLEVREVAALHLVTELEPHEIAVLLGRTSAETEVALNQVWGTYLVLLSYCADAS